jgi:hypothetical protein
VLMIPSLHSVNPNPRNKRLIINNEREGLRNRGGREIGCCVIRDWYFFRELETVWIIQGGGGRGVRMCEDGDESEEVGG